LKKAYVKIFTFVGILAGISFVFAVFREEGEGNSKRWEEITPLNPKNGISILTQRNKNTYYRLSPKDALEISVNGPAYLRIVTRLDFPVGHPNSADYEVRMTIDQRERRIFHKRTKKSFVSRYENSEAGVPGKIRNIQLFIPEGTHLLRITLPPEAASLVGFRFLLSRESPKGAWAYLPPLSSFRESTLLVRGDKRAYFHVLQDKRLLLEAEGPGHLRILTRWVNTQYSVQLGRYQVKVWEDGVPKQTTPLEANPADDAILQENAKRGVVGAPRPVFVQVPKGKHRYEIFVDGLENVEFMLARPFILKENVPKETS
jgi:hypothetical protein